MRWTMWTHFCFIKYWHMWAGICPSCGWCPLYLVPTSSFLPMQGVSFPCCSDSGKGWGQQFFIFACADPEGEDQALELPFSCTPRMNRKGAPCRWCSALSAPAYTFGSIQGMLPEAWSMLMSPGELSHPSRMIPFAVSVVTAFDFQQRTCALGRWYSPPAVTLGAGEMISDAEIPWDLNF